MTECEHQWDEPFSGLGGLLHACKKCHFTEVVVPYRNKKDEERDELLREAVKALEPVADLADEISELAKSTGYPPEVWASSLDWKDVEKARATLSRIRKALGDD